MITIIIDWIRHATSCSNVLQLTKQDRNLIQDPILTNFGITQAETSGLNYKHLYSNYKYVFTSNLRRTMETALYFFKHNPDIIIIPVPFVQEIQESKYDTENTPSSIDDVKSWIETKYGSGFPKIDLSLLQEFNDVKDHTLSSFDNFCKYVLSELMRNGKLQNNDKIVVFSHRCFMQQRINQLLKMHGKKPVDINNLDIWSESLVITDTCKWKNVSLYQRVSHSLKQMNEDDLKNEKNYETCGSKMKQMVLDSDVSVVRDEKYRIFLLYKKKLNALLG